MFWQDRPFVRILLFFLTGIFLAYHLTFLQNQSMIIWIIAGVTFLLLSLVATLFLRSYRYRWLNGFVVYGAVLIFGIALTTSHLKEENIPLKFLKSETWSGEILTEPQPGKKSVKFILRLSPNSHHKSGNRFFKVMAYFEKDSASADLHLGEYVALQGLFQRAERPMNPGEFDYRNYLKNQGIKYILFVRSNGWAKLSFHSLFNLKAPFSSWRNYLLATLRKNGLKGEEFEVAAAILLGYDQLLQPHVRQNYVAAGVIHVLCVSGMHVGIIYLVLSFLLGFLNRVRYGKRIKHLLILILIWCYALLTGLSPSVLRASVMISFFIIAGIMGREYDNYNLLAASAFFLLVFNPLFIFNVGFQLSYAAVLGILTFYFPLYRSIYFKYKFFDILWAALVLSFSAELGVFPVAVHHFHIFPIYFLLTNLLVFALAYLILSTGMALLAFSWLAAVAHFFGLLLNTFISLLNHIVNFVTALPYAEIQNLYLPWSQVWLIYLLIILSYLLIIQRKVRLLLPVLTVSLVLLSFHTLRNYKLIHQEKVVIYDIPHHTAIDFISGRNHVIFADSSALNSGILNYSTEGYQIKDGLKKHYSYLEKQFQEAPIFYHDGFARLHRLRLFILNPDEKHFPILAQKIKVDYLIYRGSRKIPIKEIMKSFRFKKIVFDASVSPYRKKILIKKSKFFHLKTFTLSKSGALVINLKKYF